tara:strand:- start:130 stop:585 length:456 start_codon:yes stop_codon:yes gene_type:complete
MNDTYKPVRVAEHPRNIKMVERLKWIVPTDEIQSAWINDYTQKNQKFQNITCFFELSLNNQANLNNVKKFINYAYMWHETSETRETCRQMKTAWKQYIKRKQSKQKNGVFNISPAAHKELMYWCKVNEMSQSEVIENALLYLKANRKELGK